MSTSVRRITILWAAACAVAAPPSAFAVRVVTYDVLNYNGGTAGRADEFRTVLSALDADVLVIQDINNAGAEANRNDFLNIMINTNGGPGATTPYAVADCASNGDCTVAGGSADPSVSSDSALFYRPAVVEVLEVKVLTPAPDCPPLTPGITPRQIVRWKLRLREYDPAKMATPADTEFYVYSTHFRHGSAAADQCFRFAEAQTLRADADALGANAPFIIAGGLWVAASSELAYQQLTLPAAGGGGNAIDPVGPVAPATEIWHNNPDPAVTVLHTESTRAIAGGLDDRYDFLLNGAGLCDASDASTQGCMDTNGLGYVDNVGTNGSYDVFGNDGSHINAGLDTSTNGLLLALAGASDHLPVLSDYRVPPRINVTSNGPTTNGVLDFGEVVLGSSKMADLSVETFDQRDLFGHIATLRYEFADLNSNFACGSCTGGLTHSLPALPAPAVPDLHAIDLTANGTLALAAASTNGVGCTYPFNVDVGVRIHSNDLEVLPGEPSSDPSFASVRTVRFMGCIEPRTLTATSTPVNGVVVGASPADFIGNDKTVTQFIYQYAHGTGVTLTAQDATAFGRDFIRWDLDEVPQLGDLTTNCTTSGCIIDITTNMDADRCAAARYGHELSVKSNTNDPGPVDVVDDETNVLPLGVCGAAPNGLDPDIDALAKTNDGPLSTNGFTRSYLAGTAVTLTAPDPAAGRSFIRWDLDGAPQLVDLTTNCTTSGCIIDITTDMNSNHVATAQYGHELLVTANVTDAATVGIDDNDANPALLPDTDALGIDNDSGTLSTNGFTRSYLAGTGVTLTAVSTNGAGQRFIRWDLDGDPQLAGLTPSCTTSGCIIDITTDMNSNHVAAAQYGHELLVTANVTDAATVGIDDNDANPALLPDTDALGIDNDSGTLSTDGFARSYLAGTGVTLTAVSTNGAGQRFIRWDLDGVPQLDTGSPPNTAIRPLVVTMDADITAEAGYGFLFTVQSDVTTSGLMITITDDDPAPLDASDALSNPNDGPLTTNGFTRSYLVDTNVTLEAPPSAAGRAFVAWVVAGDPIACAPASVRTVLMDATKSATAVYKFDSDADGDIDLVDYAAFMVCVSGDNNPATDDCAADFDGDGDGDVDTTDFAMFQALLAGPGAVCAP